MPPLETTFLTLLQENRQKILRVCRVYAWTAQDREDLYQEVLFQIWRALPNLQEPAHANTWLYRIALNTAISFVRKSAASKRHKISLEDGHLQQIAPQQSNNPQTDALYEAIGKLDKLERAVMTLFLEEMSYEQIADIMGLNAGHVGVMLHRAKKKLSASMKGEVPA
jgi:RNA polymerase sigma-70 factor (ECF subfamily)